MYDTGTYIANLYDGTHSPMYYQGYAAPQWDGWDLAWALAVGSTVVSLVAAFSRGSKDLAALSMVLGVASKGVQEMTPPRCEQCLRRSVPSGEWWMCPQCYCIVGSRTHEAQVRPLG